MYPTLTEEFCLLIPNGIQCLASGRRIRVTVGTRQAILWNQANPYVVFGYDADASKYLCASDSGVFWIISIFFIPFICRFCILIASISSRLIISGINTILYALTVIAQFLNPLSLS